MKEIILSFENEQLNKITEILFQYRNYSIINQYMLTYQRDGISLNVEYFKDLVSFSKKPTRSSLLCNEFFVSHRESFEIKNNYVFVHSNKPITYLPVNNITFSVLKNFNLSDFVDFAKLTFDRYLDYFKNNFARQIHVPYLNHFENNNVDIINDDNLSRFNNMDGYRIYDILNRYENILLRPFHDIYLNCYENILMSKIKRAEDINVFDTIFTTKEQLLDNYDSVFINTDDKIINLSDDKFGTKNTYIVTIYEQCNIKNYNALNILLFETILADHTYNKYLNYYENNLVSTNSIYMYYYENVFGQRTFNSYDINVYDIDFAKIYENGVLNYYENVYGKIYNIYHLNYYADNFQDFANTDNKISSTFTIDYAYKGLFSDLDLISDHDFASKDGSTKLYYAEENISLSAIYKDIIFQKSYAEFTSKEHDYINLTYNIIFTYKGINNDANIFDNEFISKDYHNMFIRENNTFLKKYSGYLTLSQYDFADKYSACLGIDENEEFALHTRKHINVYDMWLNSKKIAAKLYLHNQVIDFTKESYPLYMNMVFFDMLRTQYSIDIASTPIYLNKTNKIIKSVYIEEFINKISKTLKLYDSDMSLYKINQTIAQIYNEIFIRKINKKLYFTDMFLGLYKESKELHIEEDYLSDIVKLLLPIALFSENDGCFLPVNKINKPSFTNDIIQFVYKKRKAVHNTLINGTSVIKNNRLGFIEDNLLCDKLERNTKFISLINEMVIKKQIRTWFIHDDSFINKVVRPIGVQKIEFIYNLPKQIMVQKIEFVHKMYQGIYRTNTEWFDKYNAVFLNNTLLEYQRYKQADIFKQEWINTMRYAFLHQDDVVNRKYHGLFITDQEDFVDKYNNISNLNTGEHLDITKHIALNQVEQIVKYNNFPMSFYEQYFVSKDVLLHIIPGFEDIYKIANEMNLNTDPIVDWAWVYEEEEPFDDPFKIDELLLPENDSRYEDFENIIFNKATRKPRSPIKIIDDNTFIAKYPNHYPIKDENGENAYKDIALEYLDVRTSIMRQVFLGYYKIWQDHIFDFAQMTIPQSAKKILDYLYVWILMYFAEEDIPEALRVFRQIRWYLERGIIECSEYRISYVPHQLESDLGTTALNIPSDLYPTDGSTPNNTMYVDTNRRVIRNNVVRPKEAYITFYIDNNKDTTISFSLHTFTPVYIMLNGNVIDTITLPTTSKMVYNIPYTGDVNEFRIGKYAIDNTDYDFFIGKIVIPGMGSDGDLEINFEPKIQGNKVLNYVSLKVMAYMNLYHDNETLMKNLIKGNVHLSEVYEKLLTYWDLHWQNKDKGKRLTIKRT